MLHVEHNEDGYFVDDESLLVGYRRPEVVKNNVVDDYDDDYVLSEEVKFRLWLARQLAVMKASGYDLRARG